MGDWLRRLLYPLVLPTIVATVWFCGRVRQEDDRAVRARWNYHAITVAEPIAPADFDADTHSLPPVRNKIRTQFFAAAEIDDAAEEP